MTQSDPNSSALTVFNSFTPTTKALLALWCVFLVFVALGIHGSSTGVTAGWWSEKPYTGYLLAGPTRPDESRDDWSSSLRMANARLIRWDELLIFTPFALAQLSHKPRFPVVNTSIGNGQNMLVVPHTPVLHIATMARPATWGYFFLGAQRGLAWFWWFQVFACFTVLFLLFEVALNGRRKLAAFAAFWFCASAYVVCWSLWPAHVTFFAALGCLAAYHLVSTERRSVRIICSILLGLSVPGFVMIMYPAWQVPVGYFFAILFVALFARDRLHLKLKANLRTVLPYLGFAIVLAAGLTLSWLLTCLPDLRAMSDTVYPGRRVSLGGDYSLAMLFKGMYNLRTIYDAPAALRNQSEAASFYYLFPAVFAGLCLSKKLAKSLGILGWTLVGWIVAHLLFLFVGLPQSIAKLSFLSYMPSYRADLTIGLASILLCAYVLTLTQKDEDGTQPAWDRLAPWIAGGVVSLLFVWHGMSFKQLTGGFTSMAFVVGVAVFGGIASYFLLVGRSAAFGITVSAAVVVTSALFNPLATNLDHLYESELAQAVMQLDAESEIRPLWVCYGGTHPGVLITVLGGRSLSGIQWPPQLSIWHAFDPTGANERTYNQYAEVMLEYIPDAGRVLFNSPQEGLLRVGISPDYPGLRDLGARFVLLVADAQQVVNTGKLHFVYRSRYGNFSIFEIVGAVPVPGATPN